MGLRWDAPRWRIVGLGAAGLLALAGCNLGVKPVTYELVDVDDFNWPLGPTGLDSGDTDGDGDLDLVATGTQGYATLTNDGSGDYTLDFPSSFQPGTSAPSLIDIDGDGDLDLVSAVSTSDALEPTAPSVRRNDATGAFGPVELIHPDAMPGDITALVPSDADGDGDLDLLAAFRIGQERHVGTYLNDGTGAFGAPEIYSLGFTSDTATPVNLVAGDVDGDGDEDVVATDVGRVATPDGEEVDRTFALLALNDGTGAFTAAGTPIDVTYATIFGPTPALADLDGDGNDDLVVGGPGSITTLLADGSGGLAAPQPTQISASIDFITTADVDEDGIPDVIGFQDILNPRTGVIAYGDGAGGVADVHKVATGTSLGSDGTPAREVEVTDLEGDGDPDILFLGGSLGVLENATDGRRPSH